MKNKLFALTIVLGTAFVLGTGTNALASDTLALNNKEIKREFEYKTTDKEEEVTDRFTSTVTENDKIYTLSNILTEVIHTEYTEGESIIYDSPAFVDETKAESPKETMEQNNKVYKLKTMELLPRRIEERTQHVESEVELNDVEWLNDIPQTSDVEVTDNARSQVITAELPLMRVKTDTERWVDTFTFPITISEYDADYFMLGDTKVSKSDSLINYKEDFLDYLGLPNDKYKISSIEWAGEAYTRNGEIYRNATAYGQKLIHNIIAIYGGEALLPAVDGKYYHCTYVNEEAPGNTIYTMKATATYTLQVSKNEFLEKFIEWLKANPIAAFSIGTIVILIFVVMILFTLSKKRKVREEIKIIDIGKNEE
ncbi:hypothetical protein [Lacrimispora amygdalina]|uniref:hypothetical protein n=1 Tax=Lacrimispora amygdalina TaxID=253257 RepID=UPI000BE39CEF|nr:hypothetical protein [Lacrimispora amygdalina]